MNHKPNEKGILLLGPDPSYRVIEVAPFDTRSAIELAEMTRLALERGDKRDGATADWQRVKFDRQIVAISRMVGASTLYTDDENQAKFATLCDLPVCHTWHLPLPDEYAQHDLWDAHEQRRAPSQP